VEIRCNPVTDLATFVGGYITHKGLSRGAACPLCNPISNGIEGATQVLTLILPNLSSSSISLLYPTASALKISASLDLKIF
jgi:hypothetical protein